MIWVALAGPTANFSLAILSALILRGLALLPEAIPEAMSVIPMMLEPMRLMAGFSLYINVILGVFNLVPIPPLDGGRVMTGLLPQRQADALSSLEPFGFIIIILLVFFTDIWRIVLAPVIFYLVGLLAGSQIFVIERVIHFLFGR
jgi:Zn-dependent protease